VPALLAVMCRDDVIVFNLTPVKRLGAGTNRIQTASPNNTQRQQAPLQVDDRSATKALVGIVAAALHQQTQHDPHNHALAGRAGLRDGQSQELLRLGRVDRVWHLVDLPQGLPHGSPGAELDDARTGHVEGCPRAAVWSGCAKPTRCHTAPACKIIGDPVVSLRSLLAKHLTQNQMFSSRHTAGQSQQPNSLPIYISCYINGYGRP
jgi:hypothetical protein